MLTQTLFPVTSAFDDIFGEFSTKVYNTDTGYPKTNIYTDEDDNAFIAVAVTGIPERDISVYVDDDDYLVVEANVANDTRKYQHKGYPIKSFKKRFWVDNKYEIGQAVVENGELIIRLNRTTPKRRNIEIISPKELPEVA
jgi:HSP20 family molecular chaperone IbpA